jgi:hypothetical protein
MGPAARGKHNEVLSRIHDTLAAEIEKTRKRVAARAAKRG